MGTFVRHFKALNKKNWINYKRTPTGNLVELCCPIVMCLMLYAIKLRIPYTVFTNMDFTMLNHGLYPVIKQNRDGDYKVTLRSLME